MRKLQDKRGFTLIELIVAIAIGTIITAAATSAMLVGLRIYSSSSKLALRQNEVRLAITVIERLVGELSVGTVEGTTVQKADGGVLLKFDDGKKAVVTGSGTAILEDVESFGVNQEGNLLTFTVKVDGQTYEFSVCCRMMKEAAGADTALFSRREQTPEEIMAAAIDDEALTPGVRAFLKALASQHGSTGRIQTESGEGEYYSAWYVGGYEGNPDWNEETPWCACFISWALEECRGYISGETPRFANVDKFWAEFVTTDSWKSSDPQPGDVAFFDWIVDDEINTQHVGVVLTVREGWLYTIEGNSNGAVEICRYALEDPCILGYGSLNWH